jgi:3-mercaptopyruvate sulfurtransferase SseA
MTATALMAALEHYGIAKGEVKLYDGSWTEYSGKQKEVSK